MQLWLPDEDDFGIPFVPPPQSPPAETVPGAMHVTDRAAEKLPTLGTSPSTPATVAERSYTACYTSRCAHSVVRAGLSSWHIQYHAFSVPMLVHMALNQVCQRVMARKWHGLKNRCASSRFGRLETFS